MAAHRLAVEVDSVACDACPVGRAWGRDSGGFCPMIPRELAPGEALCRAAYPGEHIYFLKEGVVATEEGNVLRLRLPGSVVGIECLHRDRYAVTARALTPVTACGAPREAIRRWLR